MILSFLDLTICCMLTLCIMQVSSFFFFSNSSICSSSRDKAVTNILIFLGSSQSVVTAEFHAIFTNMIKYLHNVYLQICKLK